MMDQITKNKVRTDMVVLDVGHGNASVIHEGEITVVVDAALRSYLLEYLQQQGIKTIDVLVLSHADEDHIGGLVGILAAGIRVKVIKLNSDSQKETQTWRDLVFQLDQSQRNGELRFEVGLTSGPLLVEKFEHYTLEVVMPTSAIAALGVGAKDRFGKTITSNSISACIRVIFDNQPVALITGDMDDISLAEAIFTHADLSAPLLVFPHHGGLPGTTNPTDFTNNLLGSVKPRSVIFSIGRNKHQNPNAEILAAIRTYDDNIHIACTQLSRACAKEVSTNDSHLSPAFSAGSAHKLCCAGSIVIDPVLALIALPTITHHAEFVGNIPTAMCRAT